MLAQGGCFLGGNDRDETLLASWTESERQRGEPQTVSRYGGQVLGGGRSRAHCPRWANLLILDILNLGGNSEGNNLTGCGPGARTRSDATA